MQLYSFHLSCSLMKQICFKFYFNIFIILLSTYLPKQTTNTKNIPAFTPKQLIFIRLQIK